VPPLFRVLPAMDLFAQFESLEEKRLELEAKLSDPRVIAQQSEFQRVARSHSQVSRLHEKYCQYKRVLKELEDNRELLQQEEDQEMQDMARAEIEELSGQAAGLEQELRIMLLPKDPNDEKNTLLEIRAGTGGNEAALFVADLVRMYGRYAETRGWRVEVMSSSPAEVGGFKEIIALISGDHVYSRLKHESGVHRVQRVPETEAQGRIHTSTVTVAVLPEVEEVELNIDPNELRFDVFRSSGPGGQSVNTTDSAVRVTHLPTGLVVTCQDEKSQHKNKAKALKVLRARLLDQMESARHDLISAERKSQVGTGERSERIRTYNYPQGRVSDHRINLTLYKLDEILIGRLDDLIEPLIAHYQTEALKSLQ
jgi:peptide chain release factor 1